MLKIIQEIEKYMRSFIEKRNPAFSNMPVCPFAKKVRVEKRIDYQVGPFSLENIPDLLLKIDAFKAQDHHEILMFVHPDKEGLSHEDLDKIIAQVGDKIGPDCVAFGGHPSDPFEFHGIKTRQDPYPNFQIIKKQVLTEAEEKLKKTKYHGS